MAKRTGPRLASSLLSGAREREGEAQQDRSMEAFLGNGMKVVRDIRGVNINSRERSAGESPSSYTVRFVDPISNASQIQIGQVSLPVRAIYNVAEPRVHFPVGLPYEPSTATEDINLEIRVQWLALTRDTALSLSAETNPTITDTLVLHDTTFDIQLPRKLNPVTSFALDDLYLLFTTQLPHGLGVATNSFRFLNRSCRLVGGLLSGVAELFPPTATCLSAGIVETLSLPLVEVVNETQFRVRLDLLKLYATNPLTALSGLLFLQSDTLTLSETLVALNRELEDLNATDTEVDVPEEVSPLLVAGKLSRKAVPDRIEFWLRMSEKVSEEATFRNGAVLEWFPTSDIVRFLLLRDSYYQSSVLSKLKGKRSPSIEDAIVFPVIQVAGGTLLVALGFGEAGPLATRCDIVTEGDTELETDFTPHGYRQPSRRGRNMIQTTLQESARRNASESTHFIWKLKAGDVSGDPWRRDIAARPGSYDDPQALAAMLTERTRGLTFLENEPRNLVLEDIGEQEVVVTLPPGTYTTESLRMTLESSIRKATLDTRFMVEFAALTPQGFLPRKRDTLPELTETEGFPRRASWSISHTGGLPFGLRFVGSWARRIGYLRNDYRDRTFYVSDEFSLDVGLPFDMNMVAIQDAERVTHLRVSASSRPVPNPQMPQAPVLNTGYHRFAVSCRVHPANEDNEVWLSFQNLERKGPASMTRVKEGDVLLLRQGSTTRAIVVKRGFTSEVDPEWDASLGIPAAFYGTQGLLTALSSGDALSVMPLGSSQRFQLLFGLDPLITMWRITGFGPTVYPVVPSLLRGEVSTHSPMSSTGRNESSLRSARGQLFGSRRQGIGITDSGQLLLASPSARSGTTRVSGTKVLGAESPDQLQLTDTEASRLVLETFGRYLASSLDGSSFERRGTAVLFAQALTTNTSGVGGGAAAEDGRFASSTVIESPTPIRLEEPGCIFMRISIPGSDTQRVHRMEQMAAGRSFAVFCKFSINRHDYANLSEQVLNSDLVGLNDIKAIKIEWLTPDMRHVDWHGMEHEFTLLFGFSDIRPSIGTNV